MRLHYLTETGETLSSTTVRCSVVVIRACLIAAVAYRQQSAYIKVARPLGIARSFECDRNVEYFRGAPRPPVPSALCASLPRGTRFFSSHAAAIPRADVNRPLLSHFNEKRSVGLVVRSRNSSSKKGNVLTQAVRSRISGDWGIPE